MYHDNDLMLDMEGLKVSKKVMTMVLALFMLLCHAACGNAPDPVKTTASPGGTTESPEVVLTDAPEESEPGNAASAEEKSLSERIAEINPSNKYGELAAAHKICQEQFELAVASAEKAGLSEDSTLGGLIEEWRQQLGDLRNYLKEYEGSGEEALNALDEDADFMYYAEASLNHLVRLYNMTSAISADPALWLERYTLVPQSLAEEVETDGSWPEGYFFSDRVPATDSVDSLLVSETGKEYGFEDGIEYAVCVNKFEEDTALSYIDQLLEAGFREAAKAEMSGAFMWFGRLDDSEGHISAMIVYNGGAAGTAVDPAFMAQFYNCDMVGILIDIGSIY